MAASITYEWIPDPQQYANAMYNTAAGLRNVAAPLLFAQKQMQEEIKASFLSETSPDGREWEDWSDSYRYTAEEYPNAGILRQSERLYDAAISDDAFVISGDTLFYDSKDWPVSNDEHQVSYGWVHQRGSTKRNIPKREFVGTSPEGEAKVMGAFMEWFDNTLALYLTPSGGLGLRGRSSLGTFVGMEPMPFRPGRRRMR